jgi:LPS sulfotransferase NodH
MRAVILVRRQLDAYISLAKATALDTWSDRDTTPVKVKLDPARFARWLEIEEAWYAHWKAWLSRRAFPVEIIRYEAHLSAAPESALRRFASATSSLGIVLRVPATLSEPGLAVQDREKVAAFKVRNWPEFSRALGEMGLEKRAFGYPI